MNHLRHARKIQGALPRLLGLASRSDASGGAIEAALGPVYARPMTVLPSMFSNIMSHTSFTSAALWEDPSSDAEEEQFELSSDEAEQTVLTLPSNLDVLGTINPELRQVMEAHTEHAREAQVGARLQIEQLLAESQGGKKVNITKTALNRLRVDQLRLQLEALNGDVRGNKAALVQRLLQAVEDDDAATTVAAVVSVMGEGELSRKEMARQGRVLAMRGSGSGAHGLPETQFKQLQEATVSNPAPFTRAFSSPHDVARLLADARAEDVTIVDVRGHCTFTDYMVIATGRSFRTVHMLAAAVLHELKRRCAEVAPDVPPAVEGDGDPNPEWLVVDAGSVVVHIFAEGARQEYDLEGLWGRGNNVTHVAPRVPSMQTLDTMQV